ncbi:hypothetical protein GE09DRAFT_1264307 [Coniochaeta sp. 2T2.1]|nr:hypothetical protein GE09DRAFT_1264307 [Coniochaeta sp. 2T2.1]
MAAKNGFQILSLSNYAPTVRDYKKLKAHRKARSGCVACKEKRVKCDEVQPICQRCQRNSRTCLYGNRPQAQGAVVQRGAAIRHNGSMSNLGSVTIMPFMSPSAINGTSSAYLVQHFVRDWADIFHIPRSTELLDLTKSNTLVLSTVLAISACHLRHKAPGLIQNRIAEHFQQFLALQRFQQLLKTPPKQLTKPNLEALLLCAQLLNMLAFALPESEESRHGPSPYTSWVFSLQKDRLGWLGLQAGVRPLLLSMGDRIGESIPYLSLMLLGTEVDRWSYRSMMHSPKDVVPMLWMRVFELDDIDGTCDFEKQRPTRGEVYRAPITMLALLKRAAAYLPAEEQNVFKDIQILGKLGPEFRALLYYRDERALWIFGYWLGLMGRFTEIWWCGKRVRRDYEAITMWLGELRLTERPGVEGELWRELLDELLLVGLRIYD